MLNPMFQSRPPVRCQQHQLHPNSSDHHFCLAKGVGTGDVGGMSSASSCIQRHSVPCFANGLPTNSHLAASLNDNSSSSSTSLSFFKNGNVASNKNSNNNFNNNNSTSNVSDVFRYPHLPSRPHPYTDNSANTSGTITPMNDNSEKLKLRRVEEQLACLAAFVQTITNNQMLTSFPQLNSSVSLCNNINNDNNCNGSTDRPPVTSIATTPTTTNNIISIRTTSSSSLRTINPSKISCLSRRVRELRKDLNQLRELQTSFMKNIKYSLQQVINRCRSSSTGCFILTNNNSSSKCLDYSSVGLWLQKDLDCLVGEIRLDVVSRRCRVNVSEVEELAIWLSQLSRSLAKLKNELPVLAEESKRLASIQDKRRPLSPKTFTFSSSHQLPSSSSPTSSLSSSSSPLDGKLLQLQTIKQSVLTAIRSLQPDHEYRAVKVEESTRARERRKRMTGRLEKLKFEKSLQITKQLLHVTDNEKINTARARNLLVLMFQQQQQQQLQQQQDQQLQQHQQQQQNKLQQEFCDTTTSYPDQLFQQQPQSDQQLQQHHLQQQQRVTSENSNNNESIMSRPVQQNQQFQQPPQLLPQLPPQLPLPSQLPPPPSQLQLQQLQRQHRQKPQRQQQQQPQQKQQHMISKSNCNSNINNNINTENIISRPVHQQQPQQPQRQLLQRPLQQQPSTSNCNNINSESILSRPVQQVKSAPRVKNHVKFKLDGNKCEETEIN
ncbi:hypothetical protein HELRODRAFT_191065 [Helobdella robusta]|uniref:Actin interacting protein 3 C-terminal domain-containing protein n=1 Tax=Helobdella robusta TaxID=6412 RepID=T1FSJ9_HELRO|nr:hypothetical protein HELRODRAFT_191065 [Helobdella robusta]ESO07118.1 hypothetical protein HELRODRAFT_191065 [Helobdella robusta]